MTQDRPDPDLVLLHWLAALLVIAGVTAMEARWLLPSGHWLRPHLRDVHLVAGQLVLVTTLVRLYVRWRSPLPAAAQGNAWVQGTARAVHWSLYAVLLAQPVLGVAFMQAGGKTVSLLGQPLPQLWEADAAVHAQLKDAHKFIGQGFYALFGLHVAAALWHHYGVKDGTLTRMLNWRRKPVAAADESPVQPVASHRHGLPAAPLSTSRQPLPSQQHQPSTPSKSKARVEETAE